MVETSPAQVMGHQVLGWWDDWPFANEPPEIPPPAADLGYGQPDREKEGSHA
jgi:hypothetical protein